MLDGSRQKTSRKDLGGKIPVVYQAARKYLKENPEIKTVLDYGAGKYLNHFRKLESEFPNIVFKAYDLPGVITEEPHWDPNPKDYDLILASNVINVQETQEQLNETVKELRTFGKCVIFNYPQSPRKMEGVNVHSLFTNIKSLSKGVYETVHS